MFGLAQRVREKAFLSRARKEAVLAIFGKNRSLTVAARFPQTAFHTRSQA